MPRRSIDPTDSYDAYQVMDEAVILPFGLGFGEHTGKQTVE